MKILVLTNMFPTPAKPWFGTFVAEQVDDLEKLGVEARVLAFDGTEDWREYLRAVGACRRQVKAERFDLVHAHYGLTGVIALSQRRCPVVTTFHGGDYSGYNGWQVPISRVVARLCTPVVVTPEGGERLGVRNAVTIPAGVDTNRFRPGDRIAARRELGLDEDVPYALLLGSRAVPLKRADLFDAAVSRARSSVPELRSLSLDRLTRDRVATTMNAADVGVLTSDAEGLPVAVREALACTTPVVSVPVGAVPRLLAGLPGCAIVPRDPDRIGDAIVAALSAGRAPALRDRAAETSGAAVAKRVLALYEDVLAGRR